MATKLDSAPSKMGHDEFMGINILCYTSISSRNTRWSISSCNQKILCFPFSSYCNCIWIPKFPKSFQTWMKKPCRKPIYVTVNFKGFLHMFSQVLILLTWSVYMRKNNLLTKHQRIDNVNLDLHPPPGYLVMSSLDSWSITLFNLVVHPT